MNNELIQIEVDKAWQCPYCGDWFTDGEVKCEDCDYEQKEGVKSKE